MSSWVHFCLFHRTLQFSMIGFEDHVWWMELRLLLLKDLKFQLDIWWPNCCNSRGFQISARDLIMIQCWLDFYLTTNTAHLTLVDQLASCCWVWVMTVLMRLSYHETVLDSRITYSSPFCAATLLSIISAPLPWKYLSHQYHLEEWGLQLAITTCIIKRLDGHGLYNLYLSLRSVRTMIVAHLSTFK